MRLVTSCIANRVKSLKGVSAFLLLSFILAACSTTAAPQPELQSQVETPPTVQVEPTATPVPPTATPEPEPTATPTVEPSPTATPGASSGTSVATPLAVVSSDDGETSLDLAARITEEGLEYLTEFIESFSPRVSASEGERAAAEFLEGEMESLGYDAELQEFTIEILPRNGTFFSLVSPDVRDVTSAAMSLSGLGEVTAPLAHVGRAFAEDMPQEGLEGRIAFIERGDITFEEKVVRVAEAGALAAVVYNNLPGGFGGALMNQADIPAVSISKEDGEAILRQLESGNVIGTVRVVVEMRDSQNVIAEKPGTAGDGRVVVLGAHYDTVPETQGAVDNGSGTTTLVMLAKELADREFPFTLRFIFFGVEEIGLFGSRHYVESLSETEQESIIAMLNFDSIGAGEASILGDLELTSEVFAYAESSGNDIKRSPGLRGGGSDHASFQAVGIPSIFFFGDDLSKINSPSDTLDLVQPELMGTQAALGMGLLDILAAAEGP